MPEENPPQEEGISKCQHSCTFIPPLSGTIEGEEIASLTIHYANGQRQRLRIEHAVHVADAWAGPAAVTKQAEVAWMGTTALANASQGTLRLYKYTWSNPHPDWDIAQVDLASAKTKASYVLVAMTVE